MQYIICWVKPNTGWALFWSFKLKSFNDSKNDDSIRISFQQDHFNKVIRIYSMPYSLAHCYVILKLIHAIFTTDGRKMWEMFNRPHHMCASVDLYCWIPIAFPPAYPWKLLQTFSIFFLTTFLNLFPCNLLHPPVCLVIAPCESQLCQVLSVPNCDAPSVKRSPHSNIAFQLPIAYFQKVDCCVCL